MKEIKTTKPASAKFKLTAEALKENFREAKKSAKAYLKDEEKLEKLLQISEERLKLIPKVGIMVTSSILSTDVQHHLPRSSMKQ